MFALDLETWSLASTRCQSTNFQPESGMWKCKSVICALLCYLTNLESFHKFSPNLISNLNSAAG